MLDAGCLQGTCRYTSKSSIIQEENIANKWLSLPSTVLLHLNSPTAPNLSIFPVKNTFSGSSRHGAPCPEDTSPAVPLTDQSFGRPCMADVALALGFSLVPRMCANTSTRECDRLFVHPELLGDNLRAWLCMRLHYLPSHTRKLISIQVTFETGDLTFWLGKSL